MLVVAVRCLHDELKFVYLQIVVVIMIIITELLYKLM